MEAEFVAFSVVAQEAMWLKRFLCHLGVVELVNQSMVVYSDSEATIAYTKDPKYHGKIKHIDMRFNYVREQDPVCCRIPITKWKGTTAPQPKSLFDVFETHNLLEKNHVNFSPFGI